MQYVSDYGQAETDGRRKRRHPHQVILCTGAVVTDVAMKHAQQTIPHNHAADNAAVLVAEKVVKMKQRATETMEKPSVILAHSLQRLPEHGRAQMICFYLKSSWPLR